MVTHGHCCGRVSFDFLIISQPGVLKSVAATAKAEEVWLELDSEHDNSSHGDNIHDYVAWRYIASSFGMMRIYPGTEVDIKGRRANRYPW